MKGGAYPNPPVLGMWVLREMDLLYRSRNTSNPKHLNLVILQSFRFVLICLVKFVFPVWLDYMDLGRDKDEMGRVEGLGLRTSLHSYFVLHKTHQQSLDPHPSTPRFYRVSRFLVVILDARQ